MDETQTPRRRLLWLQFGFVCAFAIVFLRLAYWQLWQHGELSTVADEQYQLAQRLRAPRGRILDRHGSPLAINEERYTLFVEPQQLTQDPQLVATSLAPLLLPSFIETPQQATDEAWLTERTTLLEAELVTSLADKNRRWIPLAHRLSREQKTSIEALAIHGIGFDPHLYRSYPDASVSAHLLGFLGKDNLGEDLGYFGVEGYYDRELRGREGLFSQQFNAVGLPLLLGEKARIESHQGSDLRLTIDRGLQFKVEEALKRGLERYGASAGEVIIMDPYTGGILAMAAFPNYDPGEFLKYDPKLYRNPSVSDLYEPGSTLKVVTTAIGIETGAITPETQCPRCAEPRIISGFPIRTWNEEYHPNITVRDALAQSDNTAMVFIQEEVGKETFLKYLRDFGLNEKTGIDVQGEAQYQFREDKDWRTIDAATSSFGQGIAVTSINLVRAVSAIANGGQLVRPHVVDAVIDRDKELPVQTEVQRTVISNDTAKTVTEMMVNSASQGDAKWLAEKNIRVAGKTGTAQIAEEGKYRETGTITSFVGFAPAENPQFVMLVKLREPTSSPWGSETAAPLWYEILHYLL